MAPVNGIPEDPFLPTVICRVIVSEPHIFEAKWSPSPFQRVNCCIDGASRAGKFRDALCIPAPGPCLAFLIFLPLVINFYCEYYQALVFSSEHKLRIISGWVFVASRYKLSYHLAPQSQLRFLCVRGIRGMGDLKPGL